MVDTILHDSPDLVIYRSEIWAVSEATGWAQEMFGVSSRSTVQLCMHARYTVHCPAGTQSRYQYQTLCVSLAAV